MVVLAREALLDEAFLQLAQEELNVAFKLDWVSNAAGGEVAINALLGELFKGELGHEALGK